MEKIRVQKQEFEIRCIQPESENVIRIEFSRDVPERLSYFELLTDGGEVSSSFSGYSICKRDGLTVWVSNKEHAKIEDHRLSLAELKAEKKASLDRAGSEIIRRGISVKLKSGETKHFSLDEHDQLNLFGKLAELTAGAPLCAYHADGEPCTYFLAEDMRAIVQRAVWFVSYHTTYLNALHRWLDVCQDEAELSSIFYGAEIPEEHQNPVLKDLVKQIMGGKA